MNIGLGLAVGGVPVVLGRDGQIVAVGFHCKTVNVDQTQVPLGRTDRADVLRPSPFQLKRNPDKSLKLRQDCIGDTVSSLVADDGLQNGPRTIGSYDPAKAIPLVINTDQTGSRTEEAVLYEVPSLDNAKSVFSDGAYVTVAIEEGKASIERKEIPIETIKAWANADDSAPCDHSLDFQFNGKSINMVVAGANLLLFLLKK
jgi:hypothetical protein